MPDFTEDVDLPLYANMVSVIFYFLFLEDLDSDLLYSNKNTFSEVGLWMPSLTLPKVP